MKLFTNGTDTYVARDGAHATQLYEATIGEPYRAGDLGDWREVRRPETDSLTILDGDQGDAPVTRTIAEWIAGLPDGGMLCSTEW